jgi:hypothetical protein
MDVTTAYIGWRGVVLSTRSFVMICEMGFLSRSRESIQYERTGNSDQQVSTLGYFEGAHSDFISPLGSRRELEELA